MSLRSTALLIVIFGVSLGIASVSVRPAAGGVSHSHLYTHSGSGSCTSHIDPLNDVFVQFAFAPWAENHAAHHGGWTHGGSTQKFRAHTCLPMDGDSASNPSFDPFGRFHARFGQGWTSSGVGSYDFDTTWFIWATADAHHEDTVICGFLPDHAIDDNVKEPQGGFNRGRDDIWKNWTNYGAGGGYPHLLLTSPYWGNTMKFTQCNGNVAWSDGVVDYIEILYATGH